VGTAATWRHVSGGSDHTCGTLSDRSVWCWGWNAHGQLATGDTADRNSPTAIPSRTGTTPSVGSMSQHVLLID